MRRSLLLAFVSTFAVASVALAATGGKEPKEPTATLVEAVSRTNHASSVHYVMEIAVAHAHHRSLKLDVRGARGNGSLFIHVRAFTSLVNARTWMKRRSEEHMPELPSHSFIS